MGPDPAVAAVRRAVRLALADLPAGDRNRPLLVALSGGADSVALAAATAFAADRDGLRAGAVVVDHGLQESSAAIAAHAATLAFELGLDPVQVVRVDVTPGPGAGGPEASARAARYVALEAAAIDPAAEEPVGHLVGAASSAHNPGGPASAVNPPGSAAGPAGSAAQGAVAGRSAAPGSGAGHSATPGSVASHSAVGPGGSVAGHPAAPGSTAPGSVAGHLDGGRPGALVLLGHTRDDQAETVLLGLGRGSGPRSIAGMRRRDGRYLRPFLDVPRATTEQACAALGLPVWNDPHNLDPAFRRVRLRREVLPLLEDVLGGGVSAALARTADLLRADLDALETLARERSESRAAQAAAEVGPDAGAVLVVADLQGEPEALRARVLRRWAMDNGAGPLTAVHVMALVELVRPPTGREGREAHLPGGYVAVRRSGRLHMHRIDVRPGSAGPG